MGRSLFWFRSQSAGLKMECLSEGNRLRSAPAQCTRDTHVPIGKYGGGTPVPRAACAAAAAQAKLWQAAGGAGLVLGRVCVWVLLECAFPGCFTSFNLLSYRRWVSAVGRGAKSVGELPTHIAPASGLRAAAFSVYTQGTQLKALPKKRSQKHDFWRMSDVRCSRYREAPQFHRHRHAG